jgi:CheY-like chemotaxis protein
MSKYRIALVDDDAEDRAFYKGEIENRIADSEVLLFPTGNELINFFSDGKNNIDVLLLEYNLVDGNGVDFALKIKTMFENGTIKISYPSIIFTEDKRESTSPFSFLAFKYNIPICQKPGVDALTEQVVLDQRWNTLISSLTVAIENTEQERINYKMEQDIAALTNCVNFMVHKMEDGFKRIDKSLSPRALIKKTFKEMFEDLNSKQGKWLISTGAFLLSYSSGLMEKLIQLAFSLTGGM